MAELLSMSAIGNVDGTGIAIQKETTTIAKTDRSGMAWVWSDAFVEFVLKEWDKNAIAIGHTRLASAGTRGKSTYTSPAGVTVTYGCGGKSIATKNSHPWTIGHVTAAHNGHLSNHEALRKKFKMEDVEDIDTDSVVFPWLLNHFSEGQAITSKVIQRAVDEIEGSFAFLVLDDLELGVVWGIRKDNPLHVVEWNGYMVIDTDGEIVRKSIERARGQLRLLYGMDSPPAPGQVEFLPSSAISKLTREGFVEKATLSFPVKAEVVRQFGTRTTITPTVDADARKRALTSLMCGPVPYTKKDLEVIAMCILPNPKKLDDLKDFELLALVSAVQATTEIESKERGDAIKEIYSRYRRLTPIKHPDLITVDVARRYNLFVPLGFNTTGVLATLLADLPASIQETWCRRCPSSNGTRCKSCYLDTLDGATVTEDIPYDVATQVDTEVTSMVEDTLDAEFRAAMESDDPPMARGNYFIIPRKDLRYAEPADGILLLESPRTSSDLPA